MLALNQIDHCAAFSKRQFDVIKQRAERRGYKVVTKWRKGIKRITLAPIVLGVRHAGT